MQRPPPNGIEAGPSPSGGVAVVVAIVDGKRADLVFVDVHMEQAEGLLEQLKEAVELGKTKKPEEARRAG